MTVDELKAGLIEHDKGVLKYGAHQPGTREFCVLEFNSVMRGKKLSDKPVDLPDLRQYNDLFGTGPEADKIRTETLLPVMAALWDWRTWSKAKKAAWTEKVVIYTVNDIISALPGLSDDVRRMCKVATTRDAAAAAAYAAARADARAADAAYAAAADAAYAAAYAAAPADAAYAAADAAADAAYAAADAAAAAYAARFKVGQVAAALLLRATEDVKEMS